MVGTTGLERIGEAVARTSMPEHAADTKNKALYVYSTMMSEKRMIEIVAKV